ncbi:MAG: hypothetical protein JXR91_01415 [Deltaproteobacteria bacterium]|nr:hypothetical protein [Deltaproteobacteria bacterium]
MKNKYILLIVTLFWVTGFLSGCTPSDDDRCLDGYSWVKEYKLCMADDEIEVMDSEEGSDSAVIEIEENGLGASCLTDDDCQEYEANRCLLDPLSPGKPGVCTVFDCKSADCTGANQCCDCTSVNSEFMETDEPFCVPDAHVEILIGFGCSCS